MPARVLDASSALSVCWLAGWLVQESTLRRGRRPQLRDGWSLNEVVGLGLNCFNCEILSRCILQLRPLQPRPQRLYCKRRPPQESRSARPPSNIRSQGTRGGVQIPGSAVVKRAAVFTLLQSPTVTIPCLRFRHLKSAGVGEGASSLRVA